VPTMAWIFWIWSSSLLPTVETHTHKCSFGIDGGGYLAAAVVCDSRKALQLLLLLCAGVWKAFIHSQGHLAGIHLDIAEVSDKCS
jgi:hypothetical protein